MAVVVVVVYLVMGRRFAALRLVNLLVLVKLSLPRAIVNLDVVCLVMIIVNVLMVVVEVLYYHWIVVVQPIPFSLDVSRIVAVLLLGLVHYAKNQGF